MNRRVDVAALLRRIRHRHRGQTFLLLSIAIAMLTGIAAMAVDIGNLWTTRRLMLGRWPVLMRSLSAAAARP